MRVGCCICSYLFSLRMPQFATRATLLSTECLKGRSLYGEAAKQFIRMTSEDSDLRSALLLEQASYCFLKSTRPHMMRKYAFHIVLAGHRFSKAGQRKHSLRCYKQAYQVIDFLRHFFPYFLPSFLSTLLAFNVLPCLHMSAALFCALDMTEWLRICRLLWLPMLQWNLVCGWCHKQGFMIMIEHCLWVVSQHGFQWAVGFHGYDGVWFACDIKMHISLVTIQPVERCGGLACEYYLHSTMCTWVCGVIELHVSTVTMFPRLSQSFHLWMIPEQVFHWKPGFCGDMSHTQ